MHSNVLNWLCLYEQVLNVDDIYLFGYADCFGSLLLEGLILNQEFLWTQAFSLFWFGYHFESHICIGLKRFIKQEEAQWIL